MNARVNNLQKNVPASLRVGPQESVQKGSPALPPKPQALRLSMDSAGLASRAPSQSGANGGPMAPRLSNDRLPTLLRPDRGASPSSHAAVHGQWQGASAQPLPYPTDDLPPQQGRQGWGQTPGHGMPSPPRAFPQRPSYAPELKHSLSFDKLQHVTHPGQSLPPYPLDDIPSAQDHYAARLEARSYPSPPRNDTSPGNRPPTAGYANPARPALPGANPQRQGHYGAPQHARPLPQPQRNGYGNGNPAQAAARPLRPPLQTASTWPAPSHAVHAAQGRPVAATNATSRPTGAQASGYGPRALDTLKPSGEYSNDQYDMRQSMLAAFPQTRTTWGLKRSHSPENALRAQHIHHCLEVLRDYMDGTMNYVVKAGDKPAGMLSMSVLVDNRGVKINGVVGLPDTKGVGVHAIRAAIEKSMEVGAGGRVELNYLPSNAASLRAFYTKAGFVENGYFNDAGNYVTHMSLDPDKAKEFLEATAGSSPRFTA